ncbi:MAG: hypothetical protein PVS2B2_26090 [Candidatus Acidiferrum sp.]
MGITQEDRWEKEVARFEHKGPGIKKMTVNGEKVFDIMESEFRAYNLHGEVEGNEEDFMDVARHARDQRLVGTKSGAVARAIGSLGDGSGYLVDAQGRPINRTPRAPVTPMGRSKKDW